MRESLEQYCLNHGKTELLAEWDAEKNGAATPQNTPHSSREKAWWRCENGHSWQARIQSRVLTGCGCPVCKGQIIQPGFNDLQTRRPDIAAEWDTEKNAPLRPDAIAVSSNRLVWWRCAKGHSYRAAVTDRTRTRSSGCPYCKKKVILPGVNDPKTLNPELAAQWDTEKNGAADMEQLLNGSTFKAWWRCPLGHSYQASVRNRIYNKTGCPYCAGKKAYPGFNDLASQRPDLAVEWAEELNAPLTPDMVTLGSGKRVWWRCQYGHVWLTAVFNRVHGGTGCPVCRKRKRGKYRSFPLREQKNSVQNRPHGAAASRRKQQRRNK